MRYTQTNPRPLPVEYIKENLRIDDGGRIWRTKTTRYNAKVGEEAGYMDARGRKYWKIGIGRFDYGAHRVAWFLYTGEDPLGLQIDHINGIRCDNRRENLRLVTIQENNKNQRVQVNNKSGVVGVGWHKASGKWLAQISSKGKRVHLGTFSSKTDAAAARKAAEIEYAFHPNHGKR